MQHEIEHIIHTYSDYLLRVSYVYVKDEQLAEEIIQDVFLKFYQTQHQYREDASLKTYLVKMTINRCHDYLRSWKNKRFILLEKVQLIGKSHTVEKIYIEKQERMELTNVVLKLPVIYREVILLYYYEDYTTSDIAQLLEISHSTIKSRLQRARKELQKQLTAYDWEVLSHESI
ncbi:sigma-70 family RNA polymerase sigma factor [Viridibacillus sp. YIM B01967]|uniref:Sigma-70 family RNA polymerase sigma factor n=1 Tax=Viridibacillus soli TaxID=2798301 RepID=A0ABS1H3C4_9BACL|nr:sigma-70 family RNA polymerase sigma factor [Viridibacillus soli]MBK3493907.1 sigma-70 family RNA polymerase sigma factor [Viridibacillus soli]